jgi:hypothetical protein
MPPKGEKPAEGGNECTNPFADLGGLSDEDKNVIADRALAEQLYADDPYYKQDGQD